MSVWHVTEADRTPEGKIRTLADLLPQPKEDEPAAPERPRWRIGRLEAAGAVGGLVLAAALIAGLNTFWPAPAPRLARPTAPVATHAPTAAPTWTPRPTPTTAPTETPVAPTVEPPTPEIVYVP